MTCEKCGSENAPDSRFCEHCGAPLVTWPPPSRLTRGGRAWWYPIGIWIILSAFFLFIDLVFSGGVTWSIWPVGIIGIFLVGFTLLRYANEFYKQRLESR